MVATSRAAEKVLRKLVDQVAHRFNEAHGTRLSYAGRFERIPLGVDTERFRPIERRAARQRFGLPDDAFVLLWVGRLSIVDKADLLPLVRAFAAISAANPARKLRLVCAGAQRPGERFGDVIGEYARDLGVGPAVQVLTEMGEVRPWLPMLYACADVFVSPVDNVQETFGLTPVEAMACGVPQIVSDWDGYRDTVQHGETGFVVPTYWGADCDDLGVGTLASEPAEDHLVVAQSVVVDMDVLVEQVQQLIDNPALGQRMGAASRRRAEQVYSWSRVVARYEALWQELSEQAVREPEVAFAGGSYADLAYGTVFAHYTTASWNEERSLGLTALGESLLAGQRGLPAHYNDAWQYLDMELMKRILAGFAHASRTGRSLTLQRIVAVLTKSRPQQREQARVRRHVAWLIKYGFVRGG
jgi:glycosyltransferase involved in cell wall biosynthesis